MQQQQQHLMQMQPMMSAYYSNNVTTDHIQQYLDENKSLILKIVESQNSGKFSECAENQARLQRNLMYLAAIADAQPQQPTMHSQLLQYPQSSMMQSGTPYMQQQQQQQQAAQQMTPQALMAARSSMLYSQQAYSALQQSQALHSHGHGHMGMSSAGSSSGLSMLQLEPHSGGYTDYGRSVARAGNSGDGEGLYLKSGEDGN